MAFAQASARLSAAAPASAPRRSAARAKVGVFYSTNTGTTKIVTDKLRAALGDKVEGEPLRIDDVGIDALKQYDGLIVGAPTLTIDADENRSGTFWDKLLPDIAALDLEGKPCAVFGVGDSVLYSDTFCDAIEEIHRTFASAGCTMVGAVSTEGYGHMESESEVDGQFLGCPFDEDNESDMTEARAKAWVDQLAAGEMGDAF